MIRVLDIGVSAGGAYRVVEGFPLRASDLLDGRARPNASALKWVTAGVLEAVAAFESVGRGHGRIDALTVFVDPGAASGRGRVALDSPLDDAGVRVAEPDLRQVGRLLYELVVREPYRATAGYPLEQSSAFDRLGKRSGPAFLRLANTLLDPSILTGGGPSVAEVLEQVGRIDVREGGRRAPLFAAAAAAVVLLGGGGAAWYFTQDGGGSGVVELGTVDREQIVDLFDDAEWLLGLRRFLEDESAAAALLVESGLGVGVVEPMLAMPEASLDLRDIVKAESRPSFGDFSSEWLERYAVFFQEATERGPAVSRAWGVMDGVRDSIWGWELRASAAGLAAAWPDRGWTGLSGVASGLIEPLEPEGRVYDDASLGESLVALAEAGPGLLEVEAEYAALMGRAEAVAAAGAVDAELGVEPDPVLAAFPGFIAREAQARVGDMDDPAGALAALGALASDASGVLSFVLDDPGGWANVEVDLFAERSAVLSAFGEQPELSFALYGEWVREAGEDRFARPDPSADPRTGWGALERIASLRSGLSGLRAEYGEAAEDAIDRATALNGAFAPRLDAMEAEVQAVSLEALPWRARNVDEVRERVGAARARLRVLGGEIEGVIEEVSVTLDELIDRLRAKEGVSLAGLESIDAVYRERRDALIERFGGGGGSASPLLRAEDRLEAYLLSVEGRLVAATGPVIDGVDVPVVFDRAAFDEAVLAVRDSAAGEVLSSSASEWDGEAYADGAATVEAIERVGAGLVEWAGSAAGVVASYAEVERLFAGAYLPDEAGMGGRTLAEIVSEWAGFLSDNAGVSASLAGLDGRAADVMGVWRSSSERELSEVARDADRPLALCRAAYVRLGGLGGGSAWPSSGVEVEEDLAAGARLLSALDVAVRDADRAAAVRRAVESEREARVVGGLSRLDERSEMERGLGALAESGLDVSGMPGWVRYNAAAWEAASLVGEALDEPSARAFAAEAGRRLGGLRAGLDVGGAVPAEMDGAVGAWLLELGEVAEPAEDEGPPFDPATEGPGGALGWGVEASEDLTRLTYTSPDGSVRLGFAAVEVGLDSDSPRLVFMGTEEVSIRVMNAILGDDASQWNQLSREDTWRELNQARTARARLDPLQRGARSWRWDSEAGRLAANDSWLLPRPDMTAETPAYPEGLVDPADPERVSPEQGPPTLDHPVNVIQPRAATFVARAAGCRLPRSDEWLAAYERYEAGVEASRWNLRDETLGAYLAFRVALEQRAQVVVREAPAEASYESSATRDRDTAAWPVWGFDDGRLWFDEVGEARESRVLRGMVGNVAELCEERRDVYWLAGSSMLSRPAGSLGEAIRPAEFAMRRDRSGWTEIGFRLCFESSAQLRLPAERELADLMSRVPYVRPGS
ncbi:MAG: hypothetical protein AAF297_01075 [Planctomycetota bacterium]